MPTLVTVTSALSLAEVEGTDGLTLGLIQRLNAETEAHFAAALGELVEDVQSVDGLDLSSLRHVLATKDFPADVRRWQRVLRRPEEVTDTDGGTAVGKALSWRCAGSGQAASVVVMQGDLFQGVVHGISIARGILCHEFAHIHEYFQRLRGEDYEHPDARNLAAVFQFIAQSLASECFAELVASRQYSADDKATFVANADTISAFLEFFEREKDAYRSHGDTLHIWQHTIRAVSQAADMIGRTIGEFHRKPDRHLFDEFVKRLGNPEWVELAERLRVELTGSPPNQGVLTGVTDGSVRSIFHALGVYPRLQDGGLYIEIP